MATEPEAQPEASSRDARDLPILRRRVSASFDSVPLSKALSVLASQAGVYLVFADEAGIAQRAVTLHVSGLSLSAALFELLLDTGLDVRVRGDSTLSLEPRNQTHHVNPDTSGRVRGRVIDASTGGAIAEAVIGLAESNQTTRSSNDGSFVLRGVPVGARRLRIHRLGYQTTTVAVDVTASQEAAVEIRLTPVAAVLDQVVTTVTGDQQRFALGNSVGTIAADSIVSSTAVRTFSDVVSGRVPGVQVISAGGLTGLSPQINMRGQNSLSLSNEPLLYVDGVRVDNSVASNSATGLAQRSAPSASNSGRLDDLIPSEIESIEIVRGPSAATLYGTDAANGVILVTTKRSKGGLPKWSVFGEVGSLSVDKDRIPYNYYSWGHTPGGAVTQCLLVQVAADECVQDSVTRFSPLRVGSLTPLGTGSRQSGGANFSGGTDVRYFFAGSYENEDGYLHMPIADHTILAQQRGAAGISSAEENPNAVTKYGGRSNVSVPLGKHADLSLSVSALERDSREPSPSLLGIGTSGNGYRDSVDGWAFDTRPYNYFVQHSGENVGHVTTGATTTWHPASWLAFHGTGGIDRSINYEDDFTRYGEGVQFFLPQGFRANVETNSAVYTGDVGATATATPLRSVTSRTSIGGQYNRTTINQSVAEATQLLPATEQVQSGASQSAAENISESVVGGLYAEQELSLDERLFIVAGLRADGASAFGRSFRTVLYPKSSASWVVSREPLWPQNPVLTLLRLRGAFGQAGVQPSPTAALGLENFSPAFVNGNLVTGSSLVQLANSQLKPEMTREYEAGLDADFFRDRVHIEGTYYWKKSTDALEELPQGVSIGQPREYLNIGAVTNWGYEAAGTVRVLDSRMIEWDLTANGSVNHNELVSLGSLGPLYQLAQYSIVAGYPLFAYVDHPITGYSDRRGDHILTADEVSVDTTRYKLAGSSFPQIQLTGTTGISLVHHTFRVQAQVDYRGQFKILNFGEFARCNFDNNCVAVSDRNAPLSEQAAAVAWSTYHTVWGYYQDGTFARLREVSLTYNVPASVAVFLHAKSASFTLAGRNLFLWTRYKGIDPETSGNLGPGLSYSDYSSLPQARYLIVRANLGI
jgi:TonB-linked SusC/RagA family outer membrane protein